MINMKTNTDTNEATRTTSSPATGSTCEWIDQEDYWQTQCGDDFVFTVGGPLENNFKYCPYCGDEIILSNAKNEGLDAPERNS
jgi:Mg2+/Co2+ transporter CorC